MRYILRIMLATLTLLGVSGPAFASFHNGAPAGTSILGHIMFEVQHFIMHMQMVGDAIIMAFVSPQTALMMLETSTICSSLSPMVSVLFATPVMSLLTFLATLALTAFLMFRLTRWILRMFEPEFRTA